MNRYGMWLIIISFLCIHVKTISTGRNYFLNNTGNDKNNGDRQHPWKSITRLKNIRLHAGDTVFFQSDQTFSGSALFDSMSSGTGETPVVITSTPGKPARLNAGNDAALTLDHVSGVVVHNLILKGSGRKSGNIKNGLAILNSENISCDSLDISGFQKTGVFVYNSSGIILNQIDAHDNGAAGIAVRGLHTKKDCRDISIINCKAENNAGDPTELNNHSGNGILAGFCTNVLIDRCVATNNGWDMPRTGNGPVGIWCYEADSVTIQYCTSFRNKTALGAADGGGFDLDGGTTNSVIQHCLSYENQGSGYGVFQYAGASNWNNNTVRFCISKNDGNISPAHAGVFIWNSSGDARQLSNLLFCNNIVDNDKGAAISYERLSENTGFRFQDNTFIVRDSFITGPRKPATFINNNWIKKDSSGN